MGSLRSFAPFGVGDAVGGNEPMDGLDVRADTGAPVYGAVSGGNVTRVFAGVQYHFRVGGP